KIPGSFPQVAVRNRFATVGFVPHLFVSMRFLQPDPSQQLAFHQVSLHCPLLALLDTKRMSNKYKPNGTCKNNVHF
ncbi:hypothetical protein N337_10802, partial [Phoenicopterus ruber ruber]